MADDNKDFCDVVCSYLNKQEDIEVIAIAHDGIDTFNKIRELKPDIAIIDSIMPPFRRTWCFGKTSKTCRPNAEADMYYAICY